MPLCWKCREFLQNKFGEYYYTAPSNHCHHDLPEEKPTVCKLKDPVRECIDFVIKVDRGWCKECRNRRD